MTAIGIDYGTSNSEVVYFDGKQHQLIKLDPLSSTPLKIRSSVFVYYEDELPLPPAELVEAKVAQLQRAIGDKLEKAKDGYYSASDPKEQQIYSNRIDSLRGDFHNRPKLQQQAIHLLMEDMTVQDLPLAKLVETGEFLFGEAGFRRYLKSPEKGRLIYSPKNFLGASLLDGQQQAFEGMIAKQLAYFKQCAEQQLDKKVTTAVIGRPVKFHGTRGEQGNIQAITIMRAAAKLAGFERVEFLEEPIAAAYNIESQLPKATNVLVVDIGGGTTDICCIKLSPERLLALDRQQDVLSVTGTRIGGMECDKNLITKAIAPSMGLGTTFGNNLPVPPTYFSDMCAVDNIPRLNEFFSDEYGLEIAQTKSVSSHPELLQRLLIVQTEKLSARLVNSARLAKEMLSNKQGVTLPLKYIQDDYDVDITTDDLKRSMNSWLAKVKKLIRECLDNSSEAPEMLFITGGMSLSPIVQQEVMDMLPGLPLMQGDAFNSVCQGLSIQAAKL
ncbi:Hsp70 family protein [Neptunicella marina]|uniref:Hsp70 family protein n=1 Tax=Neptunicella marina TaxID=2125989 RepID=A0A8J6IUT8_9ALTE|nr:Hsp70 family protein [Neptunicella marina]MBC3766245.1 Hsp70 family protein [Neptunicella marina]